MKYKTELKLWCVLCTPVVEQDEKRIKEQLTLLLAGPSGPVPPGAPKGFRAMMWTAAAMCGIGDNRSPHHLRERNQLIIFRTKRAADKRAAKEQKQNNRWKFTVNPIRLNKPDEADAKEYETEIAKADRWRHQRFSETHSSIIGKVYTQTEGVDSARDEVVGTVDNREVERIVKAHNQEVDHLVAEMTLNSWFQ